jgi:PEP-CTERM motif
MRKRLLLILLVGLAGLGADCGGGGSSSSSSSSQSEASDDQGPGEITSPVPEPSALLVFGTGLLLAGATTRRRR